MGRSMATHPVNPPGDFAWRDGKVMGQSPGDGKGDAGAFLRIHRIHRIEAYLHVPGSIHSLYLGMVIPPL